MTPSIPEKVKTVDGASALSSYVLLSLEARLIILIGLFSKLWALSDIDDIPAPNFFGY